MLAQNYTSKGDLLSCKQKQAIRQDLIRAHAGKFHFLVHQTGQSGPGRWRPLPATVAKIIQYGCQAKTHSELLLLRCTTFIQFDKRGSYFLGKFYTQSNLHPMSIFKTIRVNIPVCITNYFSLGFESVRNPPDLDSHMSSQVENLQSVFF